MKQTIYAVIGINDDEGIITMGEDPQHQYPLVCMREDFLPGFNHFADMISKQTGRDVVVAEFELKKVLERYTQKGANK